MNYALPGEVLIEAGLRDLREGGESIVGLLVAIGSPRLRRLGLDLPAKLPSNPEHRLYPLPAKDDSDSAHSRYKKTLPSMPSILWRLIPDSEVSLIAFSALTSSTAQAR